MENKEKLNKNGIISTCMYCDQVRYGDVWHSEYVKPLIEYVVRKYGYTPQYSHGICPECLKCEMGDLNG